MIPRQVISVIAAIVLTLCISCAPGFAGAADENTPVSSQNPAEQTEIQKLKAQMARQQQELDQLRQMLAEEKQLLSHISETLAGSGVPHAKLGEVASLTPMAPAIPAVPPAPIVPLALASQKADTPAPSPLSLQIGDAYLTPIGFMDFTSVNRNTVSGSGIGTNFGSIPYNNVVNGHLSEMRLSAQNSRLGFRFDSLYHDAKVTGYFEGDFLGNNPTNVAVTSNSDTFRMRLYWLDVRKDKFEVLAGQSWSLLTPGRKGISPLPSDLFYSQDIDVNYQVGLVWSRDPQLRFVYHPSETLAMGVSLESPEQYLGGSAGGSTVVTPSALTAEAGEFNNGTTTLGTPNLHPDIVAKIAWDPTPRFHGEIAGLESTFKAYNPLTNRTFTKAGGGGSVNLNFEVTKGLRVVTNNFWSDGGGRWLFGQAPDLVLKESGDIGLLHAGSTVSGLEWLHKNTLFYGYYGGIYIGRYSVLDPATGKPVGYGYTGSANSQNRSIQEASFGFNQTLWKNSRYGAVNLMGQYAYLSRNPWYVATGTPKNAHQNQVFFNLRYTLPGLAPSLK